MFGFRKKVRVFFGIVPGSFQKVPEDSGGVRRSGNCSTTSNTVAWAVRGRPSLNGPGAPAPQGPCAWEGENPKGGGLHLTWEALLPPLGRRPLLRLDLRGPAPLSLAPIYMWGLGGQRHPSSGAALPLSQVLLFSYGAWRSSAGLPHSSFTTMPSCCCWMESSPTSPSPLAGSRRRRHHRAVRVLNAEVPSVRH